jgi:Tol biopolymer transport system component
VGVNESPAMSPDGKMVAYVAPTGGRRHIWIRFLTGGAPLQITRDETDHETPRWVPDSSAVVYYTPPDVADELGTLWEISALGGPPRPIVSATGGADVGRDGRLAFFTVERGQTVLMTADRDGSALSRVASAPTNHRQCRCPRWSPDGQWLAFQGDVLNIFDESVFIISSKGRDLRTIASASAVRGLAWLPDSAHLVISSAAGSTVPYPSTFNLRRIGADGGSDRPITFGDTSYVHPDVDSSGRLLASRIRLQSDIWKIPVSGTPEENARDRIQITRQTGQAQTPSVSPDGREMVYLSDNGGHGNLWIARTDGTHPRQLTFERDRNISLGAPIWSPTGRQIAFVMNTGHTELWSINPDGRGRRRLVERGFAACWSPDGEWLYYAGSQPIIEWRIYKIAAAGGAPTLVRTHDHVHAPSPAFGALYYAARLRPDLDCWDWEIRCARPEAGPANVLARVSGLRMPLSRMFVSMFLSPDGRTLALPMLDGSTTNVWVIPTDGGPMHAVTDFGDRPTVIARQVSWSPDSQYVYAAVGDASADLILLDGLL